MRVTKEKARAIIERCKKEPAFFYREVLGANPTETQEQITISVRDHRITAAKSCHSSGKSWNAARLALWFLYCFSPAKVITTAPTDRQVRLILWSEMNAAHRRARFPLGGRMLQQECKITDDHFAIGFASDKYDSSNMQGYHSENILIILDEADGISKEVRDGVSSLMASGNAHLLEIGNPVDPSSGFATRFSQSHVSKIHISAFDTPNFKELGIEKADIESGAWEKMVDDWGVLPAPHLLSPAWVAERFSECGRDWDHPYIQSRVLGEHPTEDSKTLFPLSVIQACLDRDPHEDYALGYAILSCDVARFGDDHSIIGLRRGSHYDRLVRYRGERTTDTANRLIAYQAQYSAKEIRVDDDGVGGGVVDSLIEKGVPCRVVPMRGGGKPLDPEHYLNNRAEWYSQMASLMKAGGVSVSGVDDRFAPQLLNTKIKRWDAQGRIVIVEKADIKAVTGESPDDADTAAYAFATIPPEEEAVKVWY